MRGAQIRVENRGYALAVAVIFWAIFFSFSSRLEPRKKLPLHAYGGMNRFIPLFFCHQQ